MPVNTLEDAIALLKQGQSGEAQKLLVRLVETEPHNLNAWFWLTKTCSTDKQRLSVLETCLKHNPGSEPVRQALEKLRARGDGQRPETPAHKRLRLEPGDKVRVKRDVGEFYADFPSYTILIATTGSEGTVVSFEEFLADFEAKRQRFGHDDRRMYLQHIFVVKEAMEQGLQWPVRFEKVNPPTGPADLVCSQVGQVELVDSAALEMRGASQPEYVNPLNVDRETIAQKAYAYQPPQAFHDEHKLTDPVLAIAMAHKGPPSRDDNEIIYLRHTSLLATYGLWYRLKMPVDEEALNIILSLHDPGRDHPGCDWMEIERMIEVNLAQKPLWYTLEQKERLITWVVRVRQKEQDKSYQQLVHDSESELRKRIEASPLGQFVNQTGKGDSLKREPPTPVMDLENQVHQLWDKADELRGKGHWPQAVEVYSQIIQLAPGYAPAYVRRGLLVHEMGNPEKAYPDFEQALHLDPQLGLAYYGRGWVKHTRGDFRGEMQDAQQGLALDSRNAGMYYRRIGSAHHGLGHYREAIEAYNAALSFSGANDQGTLYNRGLCYFEMEEYQLALADFSKCLELSPGWAWAFSARASTYLALGDCKKAIADCDKGIQFQPNYVHSYLTRAIAYETLGDKRKARNDFEQILKLTQSGHERNVAEQHLQKLKSKRGWFG